MSRNRQKKIYEFIDDCDAIGKESPKVVPIVPVDLGNTRSKSTNKLQISPSLNWCFTLNNYNVEDIECISSIVPLYSSKYIIGKEVGDSGTPHLQGYIKFNKKLRPSSIGLSKRIHWEKKVSKSTEKQCIEYCAKDGDILLQKGCQKELKKPYVHNIEIKDWMKPILEILKNKPDNRTINWFYEPDGGIGKTSLQKYIFTRFDNVVMVGGKASDIKHAIVEYEKTNHCLPEVCLIDVPRCKHDFVSYQGLEELKNMFFFSGKYEGGMVCGKCPLIMVFANDIPDVEKMSLDRWNIMEIIQDPKDGEKHLKEYDVYKDEKLQEQKAELAMERWIMGEASAFDEED